MTSDSPIAALPWCACLSLAFMLGCAKQPDAHRSASRSETGAAQVAALTSAENDINFNRHIRPIISDRCFACHGPDAANQESPFRLDSEASSRMNLAKEGEPPRYGIVPGDPDASLMLARILDPDPTRRMPPPAAKKKPVTEQDVETLRRWIEGGAAYEPHWAFVPPEKTTPPDTSKPDWVRNAIDAFILATLDRHHLAPSPEASREVLIRRLYLDLLGLPPTPEEIDSFVADESDGAYEEWVDRILASPHFGERLAIDWLDVARYGDSNAIHVDMIRTSWPWRDWVINAFNQNKPYDQFLLEQLAGDLLPEATVDQKIATSFNRNHGITNEGGVIPEEFLVEYAVDRVSTMGSAMLGLTLGCARCHDHKFDPITQDDFFSLMAFFNNIPEKGLEVQKAFRAYAYPPFVHVYTDKEKEALAHADDVLEVATFLEELGEDPQLAPPGDERAVAWEALSLDEFVGSKGKPEKIQFAKELRGKVAVGQNTNTKAIRLTTAAKSQDKNYTLIFQAASTPINIVRIEAKAATDFDKYKVDLEAMQNRIRELEVELRTDTATQRVDVAEGWASSGQPGSRIRQALDGNAETDWHIGIIDREHNLILRLKDAIPASTGRLALRFRYRGAQNNSRAFQDLTVYAGSTSQDLSNPFALIPADERKPWHREALRLDTRYRTGTSEISSADYFAAQDRKTWIEISATRCMVMEEKPDVQPTYVLRRGLYDQPIKERPRPRVTPAALPPMPDGAPTNRLGLAQWMVADDNPLPSRVAVNRCWQLIFGNGLVGTAEDFGLQGDSPTHPALLDYLAVEFRESGWDLKGLIKQMVMSSTYRQSSRHRDDLAERDPENKLLARAPRFRLPAELIRDNALAASGLLNNTIGGPSVKPYQPAGLWREKTMRPKSNTGVFRRDTGDNLYRRGIYTFWKQASPPPQMELFDAPSREACVAQRRRTNTPLQALMLLNDETYLEMSRALAGRLIREIDGPWDDRLSARIERGLRLTTGRRPTDDELEEWVDFTGENFRRFSSSPDNARALLSYGERPRDPTLPDVELAALTFAMSAALNLDETITRD